jgi:hypothetical protein
MKKKKSAPNKTEAHQASNVNRAVLSRIIIQRHWSFDTYPEEEKAYLFLWNICSVTYSVDKHP